MQRQRLIPSPAEFLRRARGAHELFWLALQHALRLPDAPFRRPRVRALQGLAASSAIRFIRGNFVTNRRAAKRPRRLKPNPIYKHYCRSCHSSPSSVVCLCPSVCSPEVTVSSLHPPRLCRLVVFSIKPSLLSKHHHQPHWEPPIEIGVRRKRKKLGRASCYKIVEWAHCSVTDRINNRRQRSKVGKPRNRGSESSK